VALENLDESCDINNAWESIGENIKTSTKENLGYHGLKHNKLWFDKFSKLIDQLKKYKSLGTDQIPAELTKVGGETCSEIHKLIHPI
jgi:hypothetical protein